jgi:voltage-gated potassium channel
MGLTLLVLTEVEPVLAMVESRPGRTNKALLVMIRKLATIFDRSNGILISLAIFYLSIFAYQVIAEPDGNLSTALDWIGYGINFIFVTDFILRLGSSNSRVRFIFLNFVELLSLVLPFIRALRVFRLIVAVNAIQKHLGTRQVRAGVNLAFSLPLVIFISALAILDVERHAQGATITNFPIAIWWSVATMATVGDGNLSPVTWEGRVVASALMIVGIGLFGAVAALFAANFINPKTQEDSK